MNKAIFTDASGNIVIWQRPNIVIIAWAICTVAKFVTQNTRLETMLSLLGSGLLLTWAYLEIMQGDSMFRRLLGLTVAVFTLWNIVR